MGNKTKVLTFVTVFSSIITIILILAYFFGGGIPLEIGILFLAITEMLIGVSQYELAKSNKEYNLTGHLCIFMGVVILIIIIGSRII